MADPADSYDSRPGQGPRGMSADHVFSHGSAQTGAVVGGGSDIAYVEIDTGLGVVDDVILTTKATDESGSPGIVTASKTITLSWGLQTDTSKIRVYSWWSDKGNDEAAVADIYFSWMAFGTPKAGDLSDPTRNVSYTESVAA